MSDSAVWTSSIATGSFYAGPTTTTPAKLFGAWQAEASADEHAERAERLGLWLSRRQDAPAAEIEAIMGPLRHRMTVAAVGATVGTESRWGPAAAAADQALDVLVGEFLSSTPDARAVAALRANGRLSTTPAHVFDAGGFVARLTKSGITPTLGAGGTGVSYRGGRPGNDDIEKIQIFRREIAMFLIEQAG